MRRLDGDTREAGFTIPEVLVAILILAAGSLAVLGVIDTSTRNAFRAEQSQVAVNKAQQELEAIRQLDYDQIAMTATPSFSSDTNDPRNRVAGNSFNLNRTGASDSAEMVVNGVAGVSGGSVSPGPTSFTNGDVSGKIWRFVVWRNDPACTLVCPGTHDYKRVVVVVRIDDAPISFERSYEEMQSDFIDPEASVLGGGGGGGGGGSLITAQQLYLSDTRCNQSSRQAITANHVTHNTLDTCTGTNKPDGLYTSAPPDPAPDDPANPQYFDYADDAVLEPSPNNDAGLQLLRQDTNNCSYGGGSTNASLKIHRWVTQPMPLAFVMSGQATFEFFTKTINDVNVPGTICVFLFTRTEATVLGITVATDTQIINLSNPPNAYFTYSENPWPRYAWTRRRLVMNFAPTTLIAGQRLGIAIGVQRSGTPQDALQVMYDHPDYASRLEVKTTTPLP